jgi:hypothetical protein
MAIVYRTDGAWGAGQGSNLAPAQVDGNFHDLDLRVTYVEDNPPLPIEPVSITVTGYTLTMGLSNGNVLGPVTMTMPVPKWRDAWTAATPYNDLDFFTSPDGGFGAVMLGHTSAATFDWAATSAGGLPLYRQIVGASGVTTGISDLTDVALSGLVDGDILVWDATASYWVNAAPGTGTGGTIDWADITGKPATFPPTVPIAQTDIVNLPSDLALKAPIVSPGFSGTPTAPTAAPLTSTTQLATTAFVQAAVAAGGGGSVDWADITGKPSTFPPTLPIAQSGITNLVSDLAAKAPTASPALTGMPTAPTAAPATSTTQLATTAFVAAALSGVSGGATISPTPPASPAPGALWWSSADGGGQLYVYFNDGSSSQWVVANSLVVPSARRDVIILAVSDDATALTTGTAKFTFRMPYVFTLSEVRASLSTVASSGLTTIDVNEGGVSILSTALTIDAGEKSSKTAATAPVVSDVTLADDAEITIDVDAAGTGARGLKVYLIGAAA